MTAEDREIGRLAAQVRALETSVAEVKSDVSEMKEDMKKVLAYVAREQGAREERERVEAQQSQQGETQNRKIELTWTKLMVLATIIGVIVAGAGVLVRHG